MTVRRVVGLAITVLASACAALLLAGTTSSVKGPLGPGTVELRGVASPRGGTIR